MNEYGPDDPNGPQGQIGLATVPLDGFVSIDFGQQHYGEVVTKSFVFEGNTLQVNMRTAPLGWNTGLPELKVEILAADHTPLPGYKFDEADTLAETGFAQVVSWQGNSDVQADFAADKGGQVFAAPRDFAVRLVAILQPVAVVEVVALRYCKVVDHPHPHLTV